MKTVAIQCAAEPGDKLLMFHITATGRLGVGLYVGLVFRSVHFDLAGAEEAALALIEFIRNHPETQAAQAKAAAEADARAIAEANEDALGCHDRMCYARTSSNLGGSWYCTRRNGHTGVHAAASGTSIVARWPR